MCLYHILFPSIFRTHTRIHTFIVSAYAAVAAFCCYIFSITLRASNISISISFNISQHSLFFPFLYAYLLLFLWLFLFARYSNPRAAISLKEYATMVPYATKFLFFIQEIIRVIVMDVWFCRFLISRFRTDEYRWIEVILYLKFSNFCLKNLLKFCWPKFLKFC